MAPAKPKTRLTPAEAAALPFPPGRLSSLAFDDNGLELRHYSPRGTDPQTPHDRDEIYIVISGTGRYRRVGEVVAFAPGDVLYAAAHEEHRFEDFTPDFATWVIFWGDKR
jgi:mannose-6-phosphate isomerase-like protein (cupin superfamily)